MDGVGLSVGAIMGNPPSRGFNVVMRYKSAGPRIFVEMGAGWPYIGTCATIGGTRRSVFLIR